MEVELELELSTPVWDVGIPDDLTASPNAYPNVYLGHKLCAIDAALFKVLPLTPGSLW